MIQIPRLALSLFTLAFGFYHAILGLTNIGTYSDAGYALIAIVVYLAALIAAVASMPGLRLKNAVAWWVLIACLFVPLFMSAAIYPSATYGYTTWHVSGVATIMAIVAVRQHPYIAWSGTGFLILQTLIWGGLDVAFSSGVVGAFLLVLAAQATASLLARSADAAQEFLEQAVATEAATAATSAARLERQARIQETLSESLPLLELIAKRRGKLSAKDRLQAVLKEHELRDQIRGRTLMHPDLIKAARAARSRGVELQLLDDGGFDELDQPEIDKILKRVARELNKVTTGKVVIRASGGESWRLTMAALRKDADRPDLFLRL
jgi:hypothetical protein